jgi:hypothetical protein
MRHMNIVSKTSTPPGLPKILVDVGSSTAPYLQLITTSNDMADKRYFALSYTWGTSRGYRHEYLDQTIAYETLPQTLRDAVDTTRALRVRYIWIDSLCINHADVREKNHEVTRMDEIFTGAYCVLVATRAQSQHAGFLAPRRQRDYVTFQRGSEPPFYVCEFIDDFSYDVWDSQLNRRGWAFVERLLARRTINFAASQTYFECGNEVQCETLTKLHR